MVFLKILFWLVIPVAYFTFVAVYFVKFKELDLPAFNSLKSINTQVLYYLGVGGIMFMHLNKVFVGKLKQSENNYAKLMFQYLEVITIFLVLVLAISGLWKIIFIALNF